MELGYLMLMSVGDGSHLACLTRHRRRHRPGGLRDGPPGRPRRPESGPGPRRTSDDRGTSMEPTRHRTDEVEPAPTWSGPTPSPPGARRPWSTCPSRQRCDLQPSAREQTWPVGDMPSRIIELCATPQSVAEVSATTQDADRGHPGALGDLVERASSASRPPSPKPARRPTSVVELIERTLRGLRALLRPRAARRPRSSSPAASASARPRSWAPSPRSTRCAPRPS